MTSNVTVDGGIENIANIVVSSSNVVAMSTTSSKENSTTKVKRSYQSFTENGIMKRKCMSKTATSSRSSSPAKKKRRKRMTLLSKTTNPQSLLSQQQLSREPNIDDQSQQLEEPSSSAAPLESLAPSSRKKKGRHDSCMIPCCPHQKFRSCKVLQARDNEIQIWRSLLTTVFPGMNLPADNVLTVCQCHFSSNDIRHDKTGRCRRRVVNSPAVPNFSAADYAQHLLNRLSTLESERDSYKNKYESLLQGIKKYWNEEQVHSLTKSKLQEWTVKSLDLGSALLQKTTRTTYTLLRSMIPLPTLNVVDKYRQRPDYSRERIESVIKQQLNKVKKDTSSGKCPVSSMTQETHATEIQVVVDHNDLIPVITTHQLSNDSFNINM
jgi:hypothetical protein